MTRSGGAGPPKPKLAVVTCMDPRLSDLPGILGLKHADIDVLIDQALKANDEVVVIGGTGVIDSKVVSKLTQRGHEALAAAPNTGVNTITGRIPLLCCPT